MYESHLVAVLLPTPAWIAKPWKKGLVLWSCDDDVSSVITEDDMVEGIYGAYIRE